MLAGKRAFKGTSQASLIAAILERNPVPLRNARPLVPAALDHLVRRCLAKNPDARWESAHDVADHLRWIRGSVTTASGVRGKSPVHGKRRQIASWVG
jgi:serine/threonine protein kinase